MLKTARNLALDYLKRADNKLTDSLDEDTQDNLASYKDDPYRRAAGEQDFALFCEAVRQLPVQCRKVFVLKKVYGYSQQEIAKELGISQSTVEKHIAQGLKRCANFLDNKQDKSTMQVVRSSHSKGASL